MNHEFRSELISILGRKPGKGLSLGVIARLVYNGRASLFSSGLSFKEVYSHVGNYLRSQSLRKDSPFVRCKKRGYYAIRRRTDYPRFL